jgi:hypothetical protein
MKRAHSLAVVAAALAFAAAPAAAADGVLIAQKMTSGDKVVTHQTQIEKTRMRSETDQNGRKVVMVFDGAAGVLRTFDEQNKTYTEMTRADVERMSAQMQGAMAQMQQQLQNLPPEQRARVEAMMQGGRGMVGSMVGPPPEYAKVGTDTVGKWRCDKYEGTKNGQKSSEICTVEPSAFGLTGADFEVAKQLAEFFSKMMPAGMDSMFRLGSPGPKGFSGLPVRTVSFRNGAPSSTMEVTDVSRQNFPDALFAVPAGFTKREMPGMRGRQQ